LLIGITKKYNVNNLNNNRLTRRNAILEAFKRVRNTWPKNLVPYRNKKLVEKLFNSFTLIKGDQVLNKMKKNRQKRNNNYAAWAKANPAAANKAAREANLQWMINGHARRY
jgi:UDP-2,3-diacylglucosamine pyrophosphatase LpxH